EDRLEQRRPGQLLRRVLRERVVQAMSNRAFECLVQDAAAANVTEPLQLGFDLRHLSPSPLFDDRRIEAAELRHMKERPRAVDTRWSRWTSAPLSKPPAQLGQRTMEAQLACRLVERRPLEQQTNREISAQRDREVSCWNAVGPLFDLAYDAGP